MHQLSSPSFRRGILFFAGTIPCSYPSMNQTLAIYNPYITHISINMDYIWVIYGLYMGYIWVISGKAV